MKVAVIGGGAAGLTTLKHLLTVHQYQGVKPIEAKLFEQKNSIAGTFRYRTWEDAELVSSKYLTAFSDFRLPKDEPNFISTVRYCQYLEDYVTHFELRSHISLATRVVTLQRTSRGSHLVTYEKDGVEVEWECDAVAICTGLHVEPSRPTIPGIENVPRIMHSAEFKSRDDFGDSKSVMILGAGETAMDISYLAVTSPSVKSVTLCHRDGFVYAPKQLSIPIVLNYFNKGTQRKLAADTTIASLFDTAYVHRKLQRSRLLWTAYDTWAKFYFWLISGTTEGLDQWIGGVSKERYHLSSVILCKSGRAMPFISAPYRNPSLINRVRSFITNIPIAPTYGRTIDIAPWPQEFSSKGVVTFTKTNRPESERMCKRLVVPDMVIYATGYTQKFPFLDSSYPTPLQADHRGVWKTGQEDIGFIGFVRPAFGAIPPLCELQAQMWVLSIFGKLPIPSPDNDLSYKMLFPRIRKECEKFVVDHESYAYQLALDMGAAPSFTDVMGFGAKTTYTWAMGSNFNTKFRLVGPWKWKGANAVMEGELWDVVSENMTQCFWIFSLTYTIIPFIIFAVLSTLFYVWDSISGIAGAVNKTLRSHKELKI